MSYDIWLYGIADTGGAEPVHVTVYQGNVTYNVFPMFDDVGLRDVLRGADGKDASALVEALASGLAKLESNPSKYSAMNPPNGWGSYEGAKKFLSKLLAACRAHPKAKIGTCQ